MASADACIGATGIADTVAALPAVNINAAIPAIIMRFMSLSLRRAMRHLTQYPGPASVPFKRKSHGAAPLVAFLGHSKSALPFYPD
jgi:hypothetical protein